MAEYLAVGLGFFWLEITQEATDYKQQTLLLSLLNKVVIFDGN